MSRRIALDPDVVQRERRLRQVRLSIRWPVHPRRQRIDSRSRDDESPARDCSISNQADTAIPAETHEIVNGGSSLVLSRCGHSTGRCPRDQGHARCSLRSAERRDDSHRVPTDRRHSQAPEPQGPDTELPVRHTHASTQAQRASGDPCCTITPTTEPSGRSRLIGGRLPPCTHRPRREPWSSRPLRGAPAPTSMPDHTESSVRADHLRHRHRAVARSPGRSAGPGVIPAPGTVQDPGRGQLCLHDESGCHLVIKPTWLVHFARLCTMP
jgi:hypothetical protein